MQERLLVAASHCRCGVMDPHIDQELKEADVDCESSDEEMWTTLFIDDDPATENVRVYLCFCLYCLLLCSMILLCRCRGFGVVFD